MQGSYCGGMTFPAPVSAARATGLCRRIRPEWPGGVDLGFFLLSPLAHGLAFLLALLACLRGLVFASQGRREAKAAPERRRAPERAPAAGGAGPAPGLGGKGVLAAGRGGLGAVEPRDISPKLHCPVTAAPREDRLTSVPQRVGRQRMSSAVCSTNSYQAAEPLALLLPGFASLAKPCL